MAKKADLQYYGTGRRKSSIARVYITSGTGKIIVNGRNVDEYMPYPTLVMDLRQPLVLTGTEVKNAGMVTRDSRAKERKKYGLKAARRAPQFSKR